MSTVLQPGQIFAERYRIERFLAEGGFGAVYVAEQLATELRVAIKVLWPHVLGSKDAVEKFEQEARVAGRLNTEHIVRVIDAGFEPKLQMPFLVMELLDGEDLDRLVERVGPLPPEQVVSYLSQVAAAIDRAHGYVDKEGKPRPIVHRDLKPENIFLTHRSDGTPLVKVLDFGIAKVVGGATAMSRDVKGTPLYMAFEQAAGQEVTPRTDIWPLGLIAYFLLTATPYWKAALSHESSFSALFGEVLTLPLVPPSERLREFSPAKQLPAPFDEWFLRCVNRDVKARFASAGEAITALGRALSVTRTATPSASSDPRSAGATAFAATHHAGGNTWAALSASRTEPSPSRRSGILLVVLAMLLAGGAFTAYRFSSTKTAAVESPRPEPAPTLASSAVIPPAPVASHSAEAIVAYEEAPKADAPKAEAPVSDVPKTAPTAASTKRSVKSPPPTVPSAVPTHDVPAVPVTPPQNAKPPRVKKDVFDDR